MIKALDEKFAMNLVPLWNPIGRRIQDIEFIELLSLVGRSAASHL
jgi:hypothetical protein